MNRHIANFGSMAIRCINVGFAIFLLVFVVANCITIASLDYNHRHFKNIVTRLDLYLQNTEPKYAAFIADFEQAEAEKKRSEL